MADRFSKSYSIIDGPADDGFAIGSSNSNTFTQPTRGLYVGVAGNVAVRWLRSQGNSVFVDVPAGTLLPIRIDRVWATGTTANGLIGLA